MAANLQPISSDGGFTSGGNININNGGNIVTTPEQDLSIIVQDSNDDGLVLRQVATDGTDPQTSTELDVDAFSIYTDVSGTNNRWEFSGTTLQTPSNGSRIRAFDASVIIQSMYEGGNGTASLQSVSNINDPNVFTTFDATPTGANIKVYNGGSNGGVEHAWQFDNDGNLTVPGNTTVSTTNATGGAAGNDISVIAGAADQSDYYTTAGGNVNITGGLGAGNDGGGGGQGGSVNISAGISADPVGNAGNVVINTGGTSYTFNELTLNVTTNPPASPAPILNGFGIISAPEFSNSGDNVTINANSKIWTFDSTGNLTLPNNIIFNSNVYMNLGFTLSTLPDIGGQVDYNNRTVGYVADNNGSASLYARDSAGLGDNNAVITANATNGTATILVANAALSNKTWTFDGSGNLTLPGNAVAIKFANGSAAFGNIATINLNGNASQVLLGNGAFASIPSSSIIANGNSNVSIASSNGNVVINAVGGTRITATSTGANVTGTLTSTGKIGYASGSTVTQTTNRGTSVTIDALAGTIVTVSASMVAGFIDTFGVSNDQVDPNNDIVLVQIVSPNFGMYNVIAQPSAIINGFNNGFFVNIQNISGGPSSNEAITIRFMVIKAPNA